MTAWPLAVGRWNQNIRGLENGDAAAVIETSTHTVIATIPLGHAPQGVAYVLQVQRPS